MIYQRVLVPVSGKNSGERAAKALRHAKTLCSGEIILLHVTEALPNLVGGAAHTELERSKMCIRDSIYGEQVRFIPAHADLLLPQGFTWQGALLGRMAGGRLHMAPRLRCLLPAVPDPAHSLVLDDISDITALLSGQSRQTGLAGNEAALWWRDLPLARMMLKQGRATLSFN